MFSTKKGGKKQGFEQGFFTPEKQEKATVSSKQKSNVFLSSRGVFHSAFPTK